MERARHMRVHLSILSPPECGGYFNIHLFLFYLFAMLLLYFITIIVMVSLLLFHPLVDAGVGGTGLIGEGAELQ